MVLTPTRPWQHRAHPHPPLLAPGQTSHKTHLLTSKSRLPALMLIACNETEGQKKPSFFFFFQIKDICVVLFLKAGDNRQHFWSHFYRMNKVLKGFKTARCVYTVSEVTSLIIFAFSLQWTWSNTGKSWLENRIFWLSRYLSALQRWFHFFSWKTSGICFYLTSPSFGTL